MKWLESGNLSHCSEFDREGDMLLLGIDLESGGEFNLPAEKNFITEIGMVLWDTDFSQPVQIFSTLIDQGRPVAEEAAEYNGISDEMLKRHGAKPDIRILNRVKELMSLADYVVAHNGRDFDRPLLAAFFSSQSHRMPEKIWLDTLHDVDYPRNCASRNLTYLAGFHGILNSFPHRAVTDVLTMLTILSRYDLDAVIENARSPRLVVKAEVSFENREKAKAKKFGWESAGEGLKYPKSWVRILREKDLEPLRKECDFPLVILERLKPAGG